jgi:glycosyltransferase involved in cell wall biosynthesis
MRPRLAILIPTYDRASRLDAALAALADDLGARTDVPILVSDNASPDETGRVLLAWRERLPSLRVHRQPENVGMLANLRWLVEHAPDADYVWLLGDDDRIVPGAIGTISDLLAREQPVWLHLPHRFENAAGLGASSPCPAAVERLGGAGELYDRYHHWLTFISAQVVDRDALQRAIAEPCHNPSPRSSGTRAPPCMLPVWSPTGSWSSGPTT